MREWLRQTRSFALGVLVVGAIAACNSAHRGDNGTSETHFLRSCTESCADGYSCLCGVCTLACDDDAVCMAEGSRSAICGAPRKDGVRVVVAAVMSVTVAGARRIEATVAAQRPSQGVAVDRDHAEEEVLGERARASNHVSSS